MNNNYNIVIATLPKIDLRFPLVGVAQLKSMVEKHGFSCYLVDLNIDLFHRVDLKKYGYLWLDSDTTFSDDDLFEQFKKDQFDEICKIWAKQLLSYNAEWIGLSFFSYMSLFPGRLLLKYIKEINPDAKIVLGGTGILHHIKTFQNNMDAYITGEGEYSLTELLKGNMNFPGINNANFQQITDLDALPFPDYSDNDFSLYPLEPYTYKKPSIINLDSGPSNIINITGSRGCVRNCTFCDVAIHWPKFRYRSGKSIVDEMIYVSNTYNRFQFLFTDSLMNGSMLILKNMCRKLIKAKENGNIRKNIIWGGQMICRKEQQHGINIYKMMSDSGCKWIAIGIESGSESVRTHMKKHFSNEDMDFTIEQLTLNRIRILILLIVGYPTETEEDYQDTLDMFTRYKKYNDIKMIQVNLGGLACILKDTPLDITMSDELTGPNGEKFDILKHSNSWTYKDNTLEVRIERRRQLYHHCKSLGYHMIEYKIL